MSLLHRFVSLWGEQPCVWLDSTTLKARKRTMLSEIRAQRRCEGLQKLWDTKGKDGIGQTRGAMHLFGNRGKETIFTGRQIVKGDQPAMGSEVLRIKRFEAAPTSRVHAMRRRWTEGALIVLLV